MHDATHIPRRYCCRREQLDRRNPEAGPEGPPPDGPDKQDTGPTGGDRFPRPPIQTLIFWFLVLVILPLSILFFSQTESRGDVEELSQSRFEEYLRRELILSAEIYQDSNTGMVTRIEGKYTPPVTGEAPEGEQPRPEARRYRVEPMYTEALDNLIREYCPDWKKKSASNFWTDLVRSLLPLLLIVLVLYFLFSRQLKAAGRGAMQFGKSRARLMSHSGDRVTFEDVAGIDEATEELQEIVEFLRNPKKFHNLGGRIPKGVLMIGPPGTGKTLLARAIAGEADVPFFSISGSDFVEMFVGVGASRVRDMFEEGKRHAPCIIFIDEIDAVGRSRFSGIGGGHDEREQTLNALLVEMDGFEHNSGIIVVAATNRPDVLDSALLRPGRFDRQINVDLPDFKGRLGILDVHARKIKIADEVDMVVIAKGTPGYSGADLANLVNEAALIAARQNKEAVEMPDLEEARDKVRWGRERRSRVIDERERRITAFHEAGHALARIFCPQADPLHKVTIVPRGNSFLGATMHLPDTDRYTRGHNELCEELVVLMGGRLAEKLVFDNVTSGAAMDLKQATEIAHRMVCEWGMSEKMGPRNYGSRQEHIYVGRDITRSEDFSQQTAREIDEEVNQVLRTAESRCRSILQTHGDKLRLLGETLLVQETMSADAIYELLGIPKPKRVVTHDDPAAPPETSPASQATEAPPPTPNMDGPPTEAALGVP